MGDISDIDAAQSVKLIGSSSDGTEQAPVGSTTNGEVLASDTANSGGLDAVLNLTTTPQEGKVSTSVKSDRKYIVMQALDKNVKWGFSNTTQSFDLFKNQIIIVPLGPNTSVWFKMSSGTGDVAFGEA